MMDDDSGESAVEDEVAGVGRDEAGLYHAKTSHATVQSRTLAWTTLYSTLRLCRFV